jgi:hypothetical protein
MARPLSRKARLCIAFVAIPVGVGSAIVVHDINNPVLYIIIATVILIVVGVCFSG